MGTMSSVCVVLLVALTTGFVGGNQMMQMVQKILEEKITDPMLSKVVMSKLPEMTVCLINMAVMPPEVTLKVCEMMIPAMNDCGMKLVALEASQRAASFETCSKEASEKVKVDIGMTETDAKTFDDGMDCLRSALAL